MSKYEFNCIKCGKCCRAHLEISIRREDIVNWIQAGKNDYYQYIQIDPKSISAEGLGGYHIEEENALLELLKSYKNKQYEEKKKALESFILKNHTFHGKDNVPLPIYTFIPNLGRMPILIPRSLHVVLEGLKWSITYILKYQSDGCCPFQVDNLCSIHDLKPQDCKRFPYDKEGNLKTENFIIKLCKGYSLH